MRWLRGLLYVFLFLAAIGAGAYYWLVVDASGPGEGSYTIDMAEVRKLGAAVTGDPITEIRLERISTFKMPFTAMIAGEAWTEVDVPVYAYQLVSASASYIIDTGIHGGDAVKNKEPTFKPEAYAKMHAAMETASAIVITHEHPDHIGGLVDHPKLSAILPQTKLTKEQVEHPEKMFGLKFPDKALDGYQPLTYERYHAIAPGVVLIKAPGHTPGSQLVYVKRADGKEYLFLGDVAWRFENVERVRTRARLVSNFFLEEDRDAVLHELAEFKRLLDTEPDMVQVPGHDIDYMTGRITAGDFVEGFK